MWPWSTIRRLRADNARYHKHWSALNEAHEMLDLKYKASLSGVSRAQDETATVRSKLQAQIEVTDSLRMDLALALAERDSFEGLVTNLKAQLAEARKNDARDKRGRFTKASA